MPIARKKWECNLFKPFVVLYTISYWLLCNLLLGKGLVLKWCFFETK